MKKRKASKALMYKLLSIILVIFLSWVITSFIYKHILFPTKYSDIVNEAAKTYNVDPYLIYAIIKQESKFNKNAVSKASAKGLMQIMTKTADEMASQITMIDKNNYDILDPNINIELGTKYISMLISKYSGNYHIALAAYNAGMGTIDKWFTKPYDNYIDVVKEIKYTETKTYVTNVVKYYNYYKKIYNEGGFLL